MKTFALALLALVALGLGSGCASNAGPSDAGPSAGRSSSGIEVFGTIDAGVSRVKTR